MKLSELRFEGPWGHCALLVAFMTFTVWYALDASGASGGIRDLLLIGPVAAITLVLCVGVFVKQAIRLRVRHVRPITVKKKAAVDFRQEYGVATAMALMALYTALMPWVGFDTATFLFCLALLLVQGGRSIWSIILFPAIVTFLAILSMLEVLSVPTPTLFMEKLVG